jgi:dTDP-4-amino-4,6-dideoxygalactose transaminase
MRNIVDANYRKYLNNAQYHPNNYHSAHALFSVTLGSHKKRNNLINKLSLKDIPTVIYYKLPIHMMNAFSYLGYSEGNFPVSEKLSQTIVSLPMHPYISESQVDTLISELKR